MPQKLKGVVCLRRIFINNYYICELRNSYDDEIVERCFLIKNGTR